MALSDIFKSSAPAKPIMLEMRASRETRHGIPQGEELEPKRVPSTDLELVYIREGIVYQWVNRFAESVLANGYNVTTHSVREKALMEEFLKKISFRKLLASTVKNQLIYGNAFWEVVKNGSGKIVNIGMFDPKFMDAARDPVGKVLIDENGNPQYYVQYVSPEYTGKIPKDRYITQTPKFNYQSGEGVKINQDEIIHFQFNEIGETWWGIGLIEPIYNLVLVKQNAEQGYAETIQRTAFPRIWVQVGDETHLPTQAEIDHVWNMLGDLETKNQFVSPYYFKPTILEAKKTEKLALNLEYFIDQIVTGLGGPKPLVTGSGEETNRSTLTDQKLFFERALRETQEEISDIIEKSLFTPLAKQWRFRKVPQLEWNEISIESLDNKAARLDMYAKSGLLLIDKKIRSHIRSIEKLPDEEDSAQPPSIPSEFVEQELGKKSGRSK